MYESGSNKFFKNQPSQLSIIFQSIEDFILLIGTSVAFIAFVLWCCFPIEPKDSLGSEHLSTQVRIFYIYTWIFMEIFRRRSSHFILRLTCSIHKSYLIHNRIWHSFYTLWNPQLKIIIFYKNKQVYIHNFLQK